MGTSPTRWYVAICIKGDFVGFYCRKFYLPESYTNNTSMAQWFFLNELNFTACVQMTLPFEEYSDLTNEEQDDLPEDPPA